ncbi:MAG: family 10 glycosylhydrolase [Candidatus Pacebacteria bacterium]|nr:family 10 glycosylhydrolase [Candidatus Paceibacterota bacterium]
MQTEHSDAVNRQRRLCILFDALGSRDGPWTTMDLGDYFAQALAFADEPSSTVDMVCWDCGYGNYASYPSDVLPPHPRPTFSRWREEGVDFLGKLVEQTRKRGLECFWSHRIAAVDIDADGLEMDRMNAIKAAHPDWLIKTWWWQGFWNLAVPEVREFKVRIIRELAERYDFDGFLIDFARHTPILPVGRQWELRENVTALMQQLRAALDQVARRRGHPILLGARVSPNLDACRRDGLDVESWARYDAVDLLVTGSRSIEVGLGEFRECLGESVKLYPCFDFHHSSDAYEAPSPELLRGIAANWWKQGADGIAGFNYWPFRGRVNGQPPPGDATRDAQDRAFIGLGDRDRLRGQAKTVPVERRGGYPWTEGAMNTNDHAQLPVLLPYDGRPVDIIVYCGENPIDPTANAEHAQLDVILSKGYYDCPCTLQEPSSPEDRLEVRLNGAVLEDGVYDLAWQDAQILFPEPQAAAGSLSGRTVNPEQKLLRISYSIPCEFLRTGSNTVSVAVTRQAPHILRRFRIEKIEVKLNP